MIKKLTLFLIGLVAMGLTANAQFCGFDQKHGQQLSNNAAYAQRTARFNNDLAQGQYNIPNGLVVNTSNGPVYEIPVVIHVIHTGGTIGSQYNPTDARLIGMIDYLNAAYAATYTSYPDSLSGGTHFPVRFVLAKRGPNCAATTGINRVNGSGVADYVANGINGGTVGADEATVKNLSRWNNHDYYNIWVVNKIDGKDGTSGTFTAGYAYFPGASAALDGTIMLATQAIAGEITLPHEVGHAFSLYHVFEGDNNGSTCPPTTSCATTGDRICDTEPMKRSVFNCPVDPNPCTGFSYNNTQRNFMDYSSCQNRFTQGQRTRWLASMLSDRASLLSSLGLVAPNTQVVTAAACIPTITNPTNTFDAGPEEVKLNDMTGTSEGGYNSDGNLAYIDRSCIQRANLLAGQSYTLSVKTGSGAQRVRVYIDYNNNGTFDAAELVYSHDGTQFNETHTTSYTVPTTGVVNCTPLRMRVVSDRTTAAAPTACGPLTYGQAEDYSVFITGPSNTATVSIAQTGGTNPSCTNAPLTFTATPAGSATTVTYKWYINGTAVTGATSNTYTSTTLANGNIVTARVFYTGPCGADSSLSNAITIIRATSFTPTVSVAVTAGSNPGCIGQSVTFTATPVNGGTAPTYTWQIFNGATYTTVPGITTNSYTTSTLTCGFGVRAILTSNLSCAVPTTATSNTLIYNCSPVTSTVSIAQTGGTNPTCAGRPVTFTATTTNPGPAPVYNWRVNGFPAGSNSSTFTTSTLNNGDKVQLIFITSNPCVAQPVLSSNIIEVTVIPIDTPKATITITAGSNPGCADSLLEFTAIATSNGGGSSYAWFLNNTRTGTGPVYGSPAFADGDKVFVRVLAGPGCHVSDTTYSDTITIIRYPTPPTPVISFIGNMLVSSVPNVQWYGPDNNTLAATGSSYHPAGPGNYYARSISNGCPSLPSNILQVSLLKIGNLNMDGIQIYPNPTTGLLNFKFSGPMSARITIYTPTGQAVLQDQVLHAMNKQMDLSGLANGIYFATLQEESGKTGTVRIVLNR